MVFPLFLPKLYGYSSKKIWQKYSLLEGASQSSGLSKAPEQETQMNFLSSEPSATGAQCSLHAETRLRQRGIRQSWLTLFLARADADRLVGDGCVVWYWSSMAIERAKRDGVPPGEIDRARRLSVIVAEDGTIVTVQSYATRHTRYQHGHASLTCRERAVRAKRRETKRIFQ